MQKVENTIWDLDHHGASSDEVNAYVKSHGYDNNTHPKYKVGQTISFLTGYNNDILAKATIKGIDGDDLYVYNDCYWFPINSTNNKLEITIL